MCSFVCDFVHFSFNSCPLSVFSLLCFVFSVEMIRTIDIVYIVVIIIYAFVLDELGQLDEFRDILWVTITRLVSTTYAFTLLQFHLSFGLKYFRYIYFFWYLVFNRVYDRYIVYIWFKCFSICINCGPLRLLLAI